MIFFIDLFVFIIFAKVIERPVFVVKDSLAWSWDGLVAYEYRESMIFHFKKNKKIVAKSAGVVGLGSV